MRPRPERMAEAVRLSLESVRSGGGPFGALVVRSDNDEVVARGANRVTVAHDPTAHAEIEAIRAACAALGTFALPGCVLYASCEPCPMCLGAIYWARLDAVFYAATRADAAAAGFDDARLYDELALPIEKRKLPMTPLLRDEALAAFELWAAKADRVPY